MSTYNQSGSLAPGLWAAQAGVRTRKARSFRCAYRLDRQNVPQSATVPAIGLPLGRADTYFERMTHPSRLPEDPSTPLTSPLPQSGAPGFLWALIGIMTAIELLLSASDAGLFGSSDWRGTAYLYGAFWPPLVSGAVLPVFPGQPVAMYVTHAFLHGGLLHLAMNAVIVLSLGKAIAARVGPFTTLLVFLLSAVAGGVAFGLISSGSGPMIGASGAAFGFLGLWNAWEFAMRRRRRMPLRPVWSTVAGLMLANVALFVFLDGGLAWEAHLGGYILGWLAGLTFARGRNGR